MCAATGESGFCRAFCPAEMMIQAFEKGRIIESVRKQFSIFLGKN